MSRSALLNRNNRIRATNVSHIYAVKHFSRVMLKVKKTGKIHFIDIFYLVPYVGNIIPAFGNKI